ncbi:right-handed parallel beta-helix repeat-containing protein [Peribacillus butanolivorans]|uniref:Right-handed parallel beta-helix repeat-containing protein n=1 Tax=Peribacillus butanolivorans TaxID=421767 RepID=A0ABN5N393_9BACI|nr:right-handed parallel beta-helix repeat-containing protein [Peribacillus butanolivorans]AXN39866.1 hypothetical protein DTO10_16860 [Peribacillus butanolivorans]
MSSEKHAKLGLHKWLGTDGLFRQEFNDNFGMIDEKVGQTLDKTDGFVNVKQFGAKGDGSNATAAIQAALDLAKPINVLMKGVRIDVPAGDYLITSKLRIYRNTHLVLHKNARILRGSLVSLMVNYDDDVDPLTDTNDIYSGHGNITIDGGIWDGNILNVAYANTGFNAFQFTRARNVTFRNIEVRDIVTCHAIDANAIDGLTIENSRFLGYKDATVSGDAWYPRDYVEAIQISNITIAGAAGVGLFDGSPCKNVTVHNNYFGASGTAGTQAWPVGAGNHGAVHDQFNSDIKIIANTFAGMTYAGVRNFKFKNCKVIGNTFTNCERDISCSNSNGTDSTSLRWDSGTGTMIQTGLPQSGADLTIQGNHFENTKRVILWVKGWAKDATIAKFDGIKFEGNTIKRDGSAYSTASLIELTWCKNFSIRGANLFKGFRGIYMNNCSDYTIEGNTVEDVQFEGIFATEPVDAYQNLGHSANGHIRSNALKNIKYNGILMNYVKGGSITGNQVVDAANFEDNVRSGINVAAFSDGIEIERNKVRKGTGNQNIYGIVVSSNVTNTRVGTNDVEGKTAAVNVTGATNWIGQYVYTTNGTRYKQTVSDAGAVVLTLG